jgi:hypothetical protein
VPRLLRIAPPFHRQRQHLAPSGTEAARDVGATFAALARDSLPGILDVRVAIPPTRTAWVRRVRAKNLWIWFTFDDANLRIHALTNLPPVPIDAA